MEKVEYFLYKDSKQNTYWAHIKVPSEVVKKFYYDVVFKFSADLETEYDGKDLFKYNMKVFSNDPAFVFTYAHVFTKKDLFIMELKSKMAKKALKKAPDIKNPNENVGYVKAIYFAYLLMQNRKLNNKFKFEGEAKPLDPKLLLNSIEDADTKIESRQEKGRHISHRKKIVLDDQTAKNLSKYVTSDTKGVERIQTVSNVKKVGKIKNVVKSTKTIKKK